MSLDPDDVTLVHFPKGHSADGTPTDAPARATPQVGDTLDGRYVVLGELGLGGFGAVLRVKDKTLRREVALKLLHPDVQGGDGADSTASLLNEARMIATLEHPGIVPVYEIGEIDGVPYITMGIAQGPTLAEVVHDQGGLPLGRALGIISQVCSTLDFVHRHGIVHRDVKPANIILEDGDRVRMVDFGVAQLRRLIPQGPADRVLGTLRYLAPELLEGAPASPRSDLYSAGITLHEMLTGRRLFLSRTVSEVMEAITQVGPPNLTSARPDLPTGVADCLDRATSKDPAERFADGTDFVRAMRRVVVLRKALRWCGLGALILTAGLATASIWRSSRPVAFTATIGAEKTVGGKAALVRVRDDTVLRAGDLYWLELTAERESWVGLLQLDPTGLVQELAPTSEVPLDEALTPGQAYRIPEGSGQWRLDALALGPETLFVVGSKQAISIADMAAIGAEAQAAVRSLAAGERVRLRGAAAFVVTSPSEQRQREEAVAKVLARRFESVARYRFIHE